MDDDKNKGKTFRKINTTRINELVGTGNKILKILYVLFIILLLYVLGLILKEWKIVTTIIKILKIISPLFIGWLIAWLLNPLVKRLQNRGMKRITSVIIVYLIMIIVIGLILFFTIFYSYDERWPIPHAIDRRNTFQPCQGNSDAGKRTAC